MLVERVVAPAATNEPIASSWVARCQQQQQQHPWVLPQGVSSAAGPIGAFCSSLSLDQFCCYYIQTEAAATAVFHTVPNHFIVIVFIK
jgi:hypothetical protein